MKHNTTKMETYSLGNSINIDSKHFVERPYFNHGSINSNIASISYLEVVVVVVVFFIKYVEI